MASAKLGLPMGNLLVSKLTVSYLLNYAWQMSSESHLTVDHSYAYWSPLYTLLGAHQPCSQTHGFPFCHDGWCQNPKFVCKCVLEQFVPTPVCLWKANIFIWHPRTFNIGCVLSWSQVCQDGTSAPRWGKAQHWSSATLVSILLAECVPQMQQYQPFLT